MVTECIIRNFKEGRSIITAWREITKQEYPGRKDFLDMISNNCQPSIDNISKGGWIMTDTCNADRKFLRLLIEAITEIAKKEGMKSNQINIFEAGKLYNILLHDLQMKILM